jgi:ketosteroid isomerase-like protein
VAGERIALLRRWQAAFNAGEELPLEDVFHPDVEFVPLRSATEGSYRGLTGIEAFFEDTEEIFEMFEMHHEYEDLGDRILVWGHNHVRARGSGIEADIEIGGLMDFRDGKIVRWEDFGSKQKALEAAGRTS